MHHTNAEKEAAYPKVRVYAATLALLDKLAKRRGQSRAQTLDAALRELECVCPHCGPDCAIVEHPTAKRKPTRPSRG